MCQGRIRNVFDFTEHLVVRKDLLDYVNDRHIQLVFLIIAIADRVLGDMRAKSFLILLFLLIFALRSTTIERHAFDADADGALQTSWR